MRYEFLKRGATPAACLAMLVCLGWASTVSAQRTINPTGGATASDGLRILILPDTSVQIFRIGERQAYGATGEPVRLAIGSTGYGRYTIGGSTTGTAWTPVSQSAVTGAGTVASPWQVVTTVSAPGGFTLEYRIRYINLDDTFDVQTVVTPPASNTAPLKLYQYFDSFLSGGDNGAAFWLPGGGPPPLVTPTIFGVTKPVLGSTQYQVLIVGNRPWDRYYSAGFEPPYTVMAAGGDLTNALDTDVSTDNGFGVQWNLGAAVTPQTIRYRWSFSTTPVAPVCGDGTSAGFEGCDDGNTMSGDGCSAICSQEDGWSCVGTMPSVCGQVCGNGVRTGTEGCDDGNGLPNDGCSATCTVESGWTCGASSPSMCGPICGNGVLSGMEACDDGNGASNDGCSATCRLEAGWICSVSPTMPTVCFSDCGDSLTVGTETCDDGNIAGGDGCSAVCGLESGWTCVGALCTPICGDGARFGTEACDDGNTRANDGCSTTCMLEAGFVCSGVPTVCIATCGDGVTRGAEACDDGNTMALDGCSATCAVETGWSCAGAPSVCMAGCGDGRVSGTESCDDGNTMAEDGCSALCQPERGYTCIGIPSICATTCGDGTRASAEACDDGNTAAADGCSPTCAVEAGFVCENDVPSTCDPVCGDGLLLGGEACDDGNVTAGDGCSAICIVESGFHCAGMPSRCARHDGGMGDAGTADAGMHDASASALDAGMGSDNDAGDAVPGASGGSCGCSVAGRGERTSMLWALAALGLVIEARRRQRAAR